MQAEIHVERGRIVRIIPNQGSCIVKTETRTHEFPGAHIYPGLVDNHAHIYGLGTKLSVASLHQCLSESECIDVLSAHPLAENSWLQAMGWNQESWNVTSFPTKALLDKAFPTTPVFASRIDGHAMWVNTALEQAVRISSNNGILIDAEMDAVWKAAPKLSTQEIQKRILAGAQLCASVGITEVHDMDVHPSWLEAFRIMAEDGSLPIRVQTFVTAQHGEWDEFGILPAGGELHRIAGVKFYADGALGSRGALLLAPYADDPTNYGIEMLSSDELFAQSMTALEAGWTSIATHAIGCAANRLVLDAYQRIRQTVLGADALLRIEHAQHVHPDDVQRMADLRVIACIQPTHCISDAVMAEQRLGPDRLSWAYRWRSLLDAGVHIGGGSDFPIEPPSPLLGIHSFVNRVPSNMSAVWQGAECLSVEEALDAFTLSAHRSADLDYRRGKIEVGYDADFTVLESDLLNCDATAIADIRVCATFVAGNKRYAG